MYGTKGAFEQALDCFQRSLTIAREISDRVGEGVALNNMSGTYEKMGHLQEAESAREQVAAIFEQLEIPSQEGARQWID